MSAADGQTPLCPVCECSIVDDLEYITTLRERVTPVHGECLDTQVMLNELEGARRRTADMEQRKNEWHDRFARMRTQRNAAHVILANTIGELGVPEDTAWRYVPELVRELRARITELKAADREHGQLIEFLHYAHGIDVDSEDVDFREWQQQYTTGGDRG